MAHAACGLVPSTLAARGGYRPGRLVRFRFTDLGDAAWDVDLGAVGGVRPAGDDAVDAEIVTEAAAFCRGISARIDPARAAPTTSSATSSSPATSSTPSPPSPCSDLALTGEIGGD